MQADTERTNCYIESLLSGNGEFLDKLEEYARKNEIPVIRKQMQSFLKTMLTLKNPGEVLEIGTAIGFSSILMAQSHAGCHITTIEKYEKWLTLAKENIKSAGLCDRINIIEGDAAQILTALAGENKKYDFIFMDAAKAQYINFLPCVKKLLNDGGVLITDNVLQDNTVIQSKFAVRRRDRTIHKRMREYLYEITHDSDLETSIIPAADGIAISVFSLHNI